MCGIVGIISKEAIKASSIKKMNDVISHRGPDGEGFLLCGNVKNDDHLNNAEQIESKNINITFGHKRLSIVD